MQGGESWIISFEPPWEYRYENWMAERGWSFDMEFFKLASNFGEYHTVDYISKYHDMSFYLSYDQGPVVQN